jgi:dTMP kinase
VSEQLTGKYIVIEGTDGAGKSIQHKYLIDYLAKFSQRVVGVAEPGGTDIGLLLRDIIKNPFFNKTPETEFDLLTAARRELARLVLTPEIVNGSIVISDRNWFSSVAYQGFGRRMDVNEIIETSKRAMGKFFMPDESVILDVPVSIVELRKSFRAEKPDTFEIEENPFFERVRQGYLWVADKFDIEVIDGSPTIELVHQNILRQLGYTALENQA